jgi:hypothetical protein
MWGIAPDMHLAYMSAGTARERGVFDPNSHQFVAPVDPRYALNHPPHRGQPSAYELNGDDGGRGTVYPHIVGHDGQGQ